MSDSEDHNPAPSVPFRVLSTQEHQELPVPAESLIRDGRPDVYPELAGSDLLRVYLKKGELVFQATGWVGLLHINPALAIEVLPRVPIVNLERVVALSGSSEIKTFERFAKGFATSPHRLPSIMDAVATGLLDAVDALLRDGLHYEYQRRTYVGSFPRGRIDPGLTALHRLRLGRSPQSVHHAWERTRDITPNQYVRAAVVKLLAAYKSLPNRKERQTYIGRLRQADRRLDGVSMLPKVEASAQDAARLALSVPAFRPHYATAIGIAEIVLRNLGVELRSISGQARLPAILINMEDIFERYVRAVLQDLPVPFLVLDGNVDPPAGAKKRHVTNKTDIKPPPATPDVVIFKDDVDHCVLVADVKYKPAPDFPVRDDLNQAVTYAVLYRCRKVCLIYPRKGNHSPKGMIYLGDIATISVFMLIVDLGSQDLVAEQSLVVSEVLKLCE